MSLKHIPKSFELEHYSEQERHLPNSGYPIIGNFDDDSIVVYQAFCPSIAKYAVENQRFGGKDFSFQRMSWIKTSFAWMNYRSGWNTKPKQERTLAIRIKRKGFDAIVSQAVGSKFIPEIHGTRENYNKIKLESKVRIQWDPDYHPSIKFDRLQRRAIQLGLRGQVLKEYGTNWIVSIEDITPFIKEMRERLDKDPSTLLVPVQRVYK